MNTKVFEVGFEKIGVLVEMRFTLLHSAPQLNPYSHINLIKMEHSKTTHGSIDSVKH